MAVVIEPKADSTYDLFAEDMEKYTATPVRGVYCRRNADNRERFARTLKNMVRDYREEWLSRYGNLYDTVHGWIGDGFREHIMSPCFYDMYKDAYGQWPRLDAWYYLHALGLPTREDVPRTFCSSPAEDAAERAKMIRNRKKKEK